MEEKQEKPYRRFEVISKELLAEAENLMKYKGLTRQELMLLLKTYQIKKT